MGWEQDSGRVEWEPDLEMDLEWVLQVRNYHSLFLSLQRHSRRCIYMYMYVTGAFAFNLQSLHFRVEEYPRGTEWVGLQHEGAD